MSQKAAALFRVLDSFLSKMVDGLHLTSCLLLLAILIVGTSDVLGRYFLNSPIKGGREVSSIMVVGIVAFSWAYVQSKKGQITIDFVINRFPLRAKMAAEFVVSLIGLIVFCLVVWQSCSIAMRHWQRGSEVPILQIPLAPFHLIVTFGAITLCLEYAREIVSLVRKLR